MKIDVVSEQNHINEVLSLYAEHLSGVVPTFRIKDRPDGKYLIVEMAAPSERHYEIHNAVVANLSEDNIFRHRSTLARRKAAPNQRLALPETQILRKELSQSLTVDRTSFGERFFERYTPSVSGVEQQITAKANYVVYGRRGAGKSSLLAYAMHSAVREKKPISWVPIQTYAQRKDDGIIPSIVADILNQVVEYFPDATEVRALIERLTRISGISANKVRTETDKVVPRIRWLISTLAKTDKPLTIFLDDIHVIDASMQPSVLAFVYKFSRDNNTNLKVSGIEQLTTPWDSIKQNGLQAPHDIQILKLDYNLTMPDKSKEHIVSILNTHAKFCGFPSIQYLAGDKVLSRLVLVAAGVPRDSLNVFSAAISKAIAKSQRQISITSINAAASEMAEEKFKDIERDTGGQVKDIEALLGEVKDFCIRQKKKNSFLVKIDHNNSRYKLIQILAALRLVHVLHEGITPHSAGERYNALMLDYGFYVGIRAARSMEYVPPEPKPLPVKNLRSLPIFR